MCWLIIASILLFACCVYIRDIATQYAQLYFRFSLFVVVVCINQPPKKIQFGVHLCSMRHDPFRTFFLLNIIFSLFVPSINPNLKRSNKNGAMWHSLTYREKNPAESTKYGLVLVVSVCEHFEECRKNRAPLQSLSEIGVSFIKSVHCFYFAFRWICICIASRFFLHWTQTSDCKLLEAVKCVSF